MASPDPVPAVHPPTVERRRMPPEIRRLIEELRAIARAPGAQTHDGAEWRTIRKDTIERLVETLSRSWRSDET